VGAATRGYDAGKKINNRKRPIVVDTLGLLLVAVITAANVQDRAGGRPVIERMHAKFPGVKLIWAEGGYAGRTPRHDILALPQSR
jgi:transposase